MTTEAMPPPKRRWGRRLAIILAAAAALLGAGAVFLRTETGVQRVILPALSAHLGWKITAEHVALEYTRGLRASGVRLTIPGAAGGPVSMVEFPELTMSWRRGEPVRLAGPAARLQVPVSWVGGSVQGAWAPLRRLVELPAFEASLPGAVLELTPERGPALAIPLVQCTRLDLAAADRQLRIGATGQIDERNGDLFPGLVSAVAFATDLTLDGRGSRLRLDGSFLASAVLPRAPATEIEFLEADGRLAAVEAGTSTCTVTLCGRAGPLLTCDATLEPGPGGLLTVSARGWPQSLHMKASPAAQVRWEAWTGTLALRWDSAGNLASRGSLLVPGISAALPENAGAFLPPLSLEGEWQTGRAADQPQWRRPSPSDPPTRGAAVRWPWT